MLEAIRCIMRVALLTSYRQKCGVGTYAENLVEALAAAGIEPCVFAPKLGVGEVESDAPVPSPPRLWAANRAFGLEALGVMRAVRAAGCEVLHLNVNLALFSSRIVLNLVALAGLAGMQVVATLHGRDGGSFGRRFKVWRLYRALRPAHVVVHNASHAMELGEFGHPMERVHVIAHGMPAAAPPRAANDARRELGLEPGRRVLAHFGFLVPDKGVLEVVRAVAALRRQGLGDLFYWICGAVNPRDESSRAYLATLRAEIERLGIAEHVHLTGQFVSHEQAIAALQAADWIVLNYGTGTAQASSGAVSRAFASGRPVAVSEASVFDDVRSAAHTLKGPLEPAIAALFANDALGRHTAERAARHLEQAAWPRVAQAYGELYGRVVPSRGR